MGLFPLESGSEEEAECEERAVEGKETTTLGTMEATRFNVKHEVGLVSLTCI